MQTTGWGRWRTGLGLFQPVLSYNNTDDDSAPSPTGGMTPDPAYDSECLQTAFDELKAATVGAAAATTRDGSKRTKKAGGKPRRSSKKNGAARSSRKRTDRQVSVYRRGRDASRGQQFVHNLYIFIHQKVALVFPAANHRNIALVDDQDVIAGLRCYFPAGNGDYATDVDIVVNSFGAFATESCGYRLNAADWHWFVPGRKDD
ncbi:MAG: hypothetical protein U5K38_18050 [Woeseiaceae bacterium]|nr:hypothetical protein [Woeseiaceae bacterium]